MFIAAATGRYTEIGDPLDADCVIGQSFGVGEHGPGAVNELLAKYIVENTIEIPMLLQNEIAAALPVGSRDPALVIEGNPSTSTGGELDSWQVLKQASEYMSDNGLSHPLLIAQAFHIVRVQKQAKKQQMSGLIVPSDLPRDFDPYSVQPWTRSRKEWVKRELPGIAYLKIFYHKL